MVSNKPRVLVVDDDNLLIKIFQNAVDSTKYTVDAAVNAELAFEILKEADQPHEIVVSDMLMPGMGGGEFLHQLKKLYPETVRILLTGSSNVEAITEAINTADIFRFLQKPIDATHLNKTLRVALEQHQLLVSEKDLLQKTLVQSVSALVTILEVTNGIAFALTDHIRQYSLIIGKNLNTQKIWGLEMAALLSQVGCISVPELVLERFYWGEILSPKETSMIQNQGSVGRKIIANIPRLEEVAAVVEAANHPVDLKAYQCGDVVAKHAAIIRASAEFDILARRGRSLDEIRAHFEKAKHFYPEELLAELEKLEPIEQREAVVELGVDKIKNGMYIEEDVKNSKGMLIVSRGYRINEAVRNRLINFSEEGEIDYLIKVRISR